MRVLIDTHSLLWFLGGDARLSTSALRAIDEDENEVWISIASLWEIAIKYSIGKLKLHPSFEAAILDKLVENEIRILPIGVSHVSRVSDMVAHHKDPFDRIIIAQSIEEQIPIVSADSVFDRYSVQRIW